MKRIGVSLAALVGAVATAYAADLPTTKAPPAPPAAANCYASFGSWLNSTAADCPLTYGGFTVYGTIDAGYGYETHGVAFNRQYPTGVEELISKNSQGGTWALTPGGLSQSQVGIKMSEPLGGSGWSVIGNVATGFDPYSLQLANGPGAMMENTNTYLPFQNGNGDSSRAGQWDNSVGYVGVDNKTFGTLTFGRQNTFTLDGVSAYDPMGGSYAFAPIGYSGKSAGTGSTEDARVNTAVKYVVKYGNFHVGGLYQVGGYDQGNGSNGEYEVNAGVEFNGLSLDATYAHIKDQVNLGTENSPLKPDALTATLSNNDSLMLLAKYATGPFKFYGGYEWIKYSNPSDAYPAGFSSIGDYPVIAGGVNSTNFTDPENLYILWTGAKYALTNQIDLTGAYYRYIQSNFNTSATPCGPNTTAPYPGYAPQGANSSKCAGNLNAVSFMIDYRPWKRVDLYAGAMYSEVDGGLANGYLHTNNFDPTVGVRVQF
jgi:predicted porin